MLDSTHLDLLHLNNLFLHRNNDILLNICLISNIWDFQFVHNCGHENEFLKI